MAANPGGLSATAPVFVASRLEGSAFFLGIPDVIAGGSKEQMAGEAAGAVRRVTDWIVGIARVADNEPIGDRAIRQNPGDSVGVRLNAPKANGTVPALVFCPCPQPALARLVDPVPQPPPVVGVPGGATRSRAKTNARRGLGSEGRCTLRARPRLGCSVVVTRCRAVLTAPALYLGGTGEKRLVTGDAGTRNPTGGAILGEHLEPPFRCHTRRCVRSGRALYVPNYTTISFERALMMPTKGCY